MKKILFITNSLEIGGQERQLIELIKGVEKIKSIKFLLILLSKNIFFNEIYNSNVPFKIIERKHRKDPLVFFKLYNIIKNLKPNIIHSWGPVSAGYVAPIANIFKIPFINSFIRNAPSKLKIFSNDWFRSKITFPLSDYIVSNSRIGLTNYKIPKNKKVCIYNGFDLGRVKKLNSIKNFDGYNKRTKKKIIGIVSNISKQKDFKTFFKSANYILNNRKNVLFILVGKEKGCKIKDYYEIISSSNRKNIQYLGNQKDIFPIINLFNIAVLTTKTEGISNSVLEYMALSKPVVVSGGGALKEIIKDGKNGFIVPAGDYVQLSNKILYLLDNKSLADAMGKAGNRTLKKKFAYDRYIAGYTGLYDQFDIKDGEGL